MDSLELSERERAEGRTAPRVSLSDIEANIAYAVTFIATDAVNALNGAPPGCIVGTIAQDVPDSLHVLTVALVVLRNGFTIIGKSAPASAENFDAALCAKLAREDAIRQIWPLMGYALREKLANPNVGSGCLREPVTENQCGQAIGLPTNYERQEAIRMSLGIGGDRTAKQVIRDAEALLEFVEG